MDDIATIDRVSARTATTETAVLTTVRVRDLPLLADVGINPDEVGRRQPLVITVELALDAGAVDGIGETVDYRRIAAAAETLAEVHIPLIETFARRLGEQCLGWAPVREARVSIDKPFALTRGLAGVEVTVRRAP
ncbi:dihydroneopterin aldolase [Novosphingobium aerophilum]|uniref:dihydroneopterin aldolase n=1 Tax=Novosphingobium TaxID=165696 RepID=UPI0009EA6DDF|nr:MULTISPECIES: dihydroneopterin aldolase [unclassified Novosphingobium]TCM33066.1 dihydroneopterin aldolase [Novosphingobium sp. ST904]WRT94931.1 dihydroneopterin aldolase [Novosphingobium sp. RL4]